MNALFDAYPRLRDHLPYVALADLPTPVERMERLERKLAELHGPSAALKGLYIKRDDVTGKLYGGNKPRKLEYLLGQALRTRRKAVLTFGAAGSNHALATALYARQVGLKCISMLMPQPNAQSVRRNLLMSFKAGAELHHSDGMLRMALDAQCQLLRHAVRDGSFPYLIPPGGSSPLGLIGFVNAGLELKRQIDQGVLPEPDFVYAASGTMGTVVGLLLGFKAAALRTQVVAVRVTDPRFTSMKKARRLFENARAILAKGEPSLAQVAFTEPDFILRHDYYGEAYALYTDEALDAVRFVKEAEGVRLEGTYTGKTFAALLGDAKAGRLQGKTVLFWNTHNSRDFSSEIAGVDYHVLPRAFRRYFEEEVQPLDR